MQDDVAQYASLAPPVKTGRLWGGVVPRLQRIPPLWRSYELASSLLALRATDLPYVCDLFRTMWAVASFTSGGPRLVCLYRLCHNLAADGVVGDIVECGVARGGSASLLGVASRGSGRHLWLFDSFEGLPEPEAVDGPVASQYVGTCYGSQDLVRAVLHRLGVSDARTHLVPGWFEGTLPSAAVEQIALLHIDADWYRSVYTCLTTLYDRVTPGGYVVLDDYGYWPGCKAATDQFLSERGLNVPLVRVDASRRYFRKPD